MTPIPPWIVLDSHLIQWLQEDIGRGDRSTQGLPNVDRIATATWIAKETGVVAALPIAKRVFELLNPEAKFQPLAAEGTACVPGQSIAEITADLATLLMGERTALNLAMRLSGIATATRTYVNCIADLPARLVDTRKTTPGLRLLEKYATTVGGGVNHRVGLDDAVMIKDNHIAAAGGITAAIEGIRLQMPYPLTIEVETESLAQVKEAIECHADIIMLDNMHPDLMRQAVAVIRTANPRIKIEASGNITLTTIRQVAETGVDYISTSAPITRSHWLDLSMRIRT
ncbi:carboxylating nicotinate-nucleotide diphosphorylase [Chamaesiphon sp. GL140_3_metabinner_50]|uniref:carboxylating nicotinate-nucleotide diphosphorylase n=1 Tax=Chamaesiphon sp. GL140_3_metabinner_50 TaxID=2970812 RepID=UPI0025DB57B7|nr:carboxylating nicotinate-nucleotide diphosphorylase [Chamaesiphon sp. GL140_3_metabinner_50]